MASPAETKPVERVMNIKGELYPEGTRFRQIIITGAPGTGKTTLITRLGGWSSEGYLDLGKAHWWRDPILTMRPREVHLGLPRAAGESFAVFDRDWLEDPCPVALDRIAIPPPGRWFFRGFRERYLFDFQLIDPGEVYEARLHRASRGSHPVDVELTPGMVRRQWDVHVRVASYLHTGGLNVIVRETFRGPPRRFV